MLISFKLFLIWLYCIVGVFLVLSIDFLLVVFFGNFVFYIIIVCVLVIMFFSLVFILIYLVCMCKIVNRKINEIEEKDWCFVYVCVVDRYLLC